MKRDNTMTKRFLAEAGIVNGMHVLEIGCGSGEVTQVLAELVGPTGKVVALDRNQDALKAAEERINEQGIKHAQFIPADITEGLSSLSHLSYESFDALAGRRVLMYLPNPIDTIRRLSRWIKSRGLIVFEEIDSTMVPGRKSTMPAYDRAVELLRKMIEAEGANTAMGFDLPSTLVQAGLKFERIRAEVVFEGQGTQYPLADLLLFWTAIIV
ncbi:MAG: class I SAM-dependent methyltransferase, partial [Calditrichota bacterium]